MIVPSSITAMVVDDNGYARTTIAAMLRKLGLTQIIECPAGASAVSALMSQRCDILFLDWYMPDMNGAAVLQVIRDGRFGEHGKCPVVMMTAYPNRETYARAKELGAAEVLTKPFTTGHVSALFGRLLPDGWTVPEDDAPIAPPREDKFFL